jgi:hypothetical protein
MKRFMFLLFLACLPFVVGADKPSVADKELAAALEKTAALESYQFKVEGRAAQDSVEGTYQKNQPISFKAEKIEFLKKGDVLAYNQGDEWKRSKTGIESDPLRILTASAKVRSARLAHEELATLAKVCKDATKLDKKEDGFTVYTAELTDDGAKKLAPTESQNVAKGGKVKLWVDKDGVVVKYSINIRLQGRQGNAEVNGTSEKTVTLSEIGKAKVEVPDGAKKALE